MSLKMPPRGKAIPIDWLDKVVTSLEHKRDEALRVFARDTPIPTYEECLSARGDLRATNDSLGLIARMRPTEGTPNE